MTHALVTGCDADWTGILWAALWALTGANLTAVGLLIRRDLRIARR